MSGRLQISVLAVIGRSQRRDHLCELFWAIPDDPRASLRWSLTKLRRLLNRAGDECLTADRDSVFLDPARIDLDLRQFPYPGNGTLDELDTPTLEGLAGRFRGPFLA